MRLARVFIPLVLAALLLPIEFTATARAVPVQANLVVTTGICESLGFGPPAGFGSEAVFCRNLAGGGFSDLSLDAGIDSPSQSTKSRYANPDNGTIPPGTIVVPFNRLFIDQGRGTILGVPYDDPRQYFFHTAPDDLRLEFAFLDSLELPPVGTEPLTFKAPFTVTGTFGIYQFDLPQHLLHLTISGTGTGTITFLPAANVNGWFPGTTEYVFGPPEIVPEPATLLLFGTTAAGMGLARWRQRRRTQQPFAGN
jgi:hypothetical protein